MKILTVRHHIEYASNAWSYAARTNLDQLTKAQNVGFRIITSGMKAIPISEEERTAGLLSLEKRREEKLLRQSEKMKGLPSHPLHFKFEAPTKNRLKRQSPVHLVKALRQKKTGSPHQHTTNRWKCFKTTKTGKQKFQPSSQTS